MKSVLRHITRIVYVNVVKRLLFSIAPDVVHERLVKLGECTQKISIVGPLLHLVWSAKDESLLHQVVCGVSFKNPVGLSAGFDKNADLVPTMKAVGFGFTTVGSITAKATSGNEKPWYYRLPKSRSIVVNAGLPNQGAAKIAKHISQLNSRVFEDFHLVASVAKTNSQATCTDETGLIDYVESFKILQRNPHIAMFELNISCPNAYGGEPFTRVEPLEKLLSAIDELKLTQPLTIKMPIDKPWHEFEKLLQVITKHNVQAVTIGNLQKNRQAVKLKDELPTDVVGNLSGWPCSDASNDLIRRTYQAYKDKLIIIGVGGIFSAEDAYAKIRLGASLVELITGLMFVGPQLVGDINYGLIKLLKRDGFKHITEAIGVDAQKATIKH